MVRDEVSDLRKKNTDTKPNQDIQPTFYHCPASATSTTDSYSHTASSTAGYSQTGTYPSLPTEHQHQRRERQVCFLFFLALSLPFFNEFLVIDRKNRIYENKSGKYG